MSLPLASKALAVNCAVSPLETQPVTFVEMVMLARRTWTATGTVAVNVSVFTVMVALPTGPGLQSTGVSVLSQAPPQTRPPLETVAMVVESEEKVTVGVGLMVFPFSSWTVTESCCTAPWFSETVEGETVIVVGTGAAGFLSPPPPHPASNNNINEGMKARLDLAQKRINADCCMNPPRPRSGDGTTNGYEEWVRTVSVEPVSGFRQAHRRPCRWADICRFLTQQVSSFQYFTELWRLLGGSHEGHEVRTKGDHRGELATGGSAVFEDVKNL
jgi:hypothetical protein